MGGLEGLFVEGLSGDLPDANDGARINFIQKTEMRACDRFADMNFETQHRPLEVLDEFARGELADCESYNEALRDLKRLQQQRTELKSRVDRQLELVSLMMDDRALRSGQKFKQARADLDRMEIEYSDVDMLLNIVSINMGHLEIDRYKKERTAKYAQMLKEFSQYKVLGDNDVRNFIL